MTRSTRRPKVSRWRRFGEEKMLGSRGQAFGMCWISLRLAGQVCSRRRRFLSWQLGGSEGLNKVSRVAESSLEAGFEFQIEEFL